MNQRETIDGIPGEWRTVTKASEAKGTKKWRIKSFNGCDSIPLCGLSDRIIENWGNATVQAFFPLPAKRKVAKVTIKKMAYYRVWFKLDRMCKFTPEFAYSSRKSALRGARRFCDAIGYEMEVVK